MAYYMNYKEKLTGEYLHTFDQIETYSMAVSVEEKVRNEMLMELLDMLYEAQQADKPVEKIVGADVEKFCKEFFEGHDPVWNFIRNVPVWLYRMVVFVLLITILEFLHYDMPYGEALKQTTDIGYLLGGIVVGIVTYAVLTLIGKLLLFRWKRFTNNMYLVISVIVSIVVIIGVTATEQTVEVPIYLTALVALAYIVIYKIMQFYGRYQKYGSIKKPLEEKEISLRGVWKDAWRQEQEKDADNHVLVFAFEKRYLRINKRLQKRGKETVSEEAFTEKIREENRWVKYEKCVYIGIIATCIVVPVVIEIMDAAAWLDILILAGILMLLEIPLGMFFYRTTKKAYMERIALIELCDSEGITLPELARRLHRDREEA